MSQLEKIIILILFVAVAGGAYYYGAAGNLPFSDTASSPTPTARPTTPATTIPSPTATPDETGDDPRADWETYSSSTYTVQYPDNLEANQESDNTLHLSYWGPTQEENTEFYDGISLQFRPAETTQEAEEYAQDQVEEVRAGGVAEVAVDPEPITINDYPGVTYTTRGLGEHQYIILQGPDNLLMEIINSTADPTGQGFQETVEQILSTFTFVD